MFEVISLDVILKGLLLLILILIFSIYSNEYKKKLPPGPWGIPIFGVMPFLNKPLHLKFQEYFKKYGKLCSFYIGNRLTVLISDFDLIKEAFVRQGEFFSGRPENMTFRVFPQENRLATSEGDAFKQYKSFIVSALKDVGVSSEAIIKNNAQNFINYINETDGKTVNILKPIGLTIAQTYIQRLLGIRLEFDDPTLEKLVSLFYQEGRLYGIGARMYLPWTKKIPIVSKYIGEDDIRKLRIKIYEILETLLKDNLNSYVEGSRQNFVHSWLTEDLRKKLKNPNNNLFGRNSLFFNLEGVLSAGYETTSTTLCWACFLLLNHSHVQDKIVEELNAVVGHDRPLSFDDEVLLPYTLATIQEIHRFATIFPLALPHKTKEKTILGGFHIPENSIIFANMYSVRTDPVLFPEPYKFKPERFINEEGKFIKDEHVLPFSIGKRQCPGEKTAQKLIFIYLTYLLQSFRFEKAEDDKLKESRRDSNFSLLPMNYNLRFVNRKSNLQIIK